MSRWAAAAQHRRRSVVAWLTAEICAMPIDSAVDIAYRRQIQAAEDPATHREAVIDRLRADVNPLRAASGFGIDDIRSPRPDQSGLIQALRRPGGGVPIGFPESVALDLADLILTPV